MDFPIAYPASVDLSRFEGSGTGETLYGLPREVAFCQSCVISNQRPNSAVELNGHHTVAAFVGSGNLWGSQFHPEKSGGPGLAILKAFSDA